MSVVDRERLLRFSLFDGCHPELELHLQGDCKGLQTVTHIKTLYCAAPDDRMAICDAVRLLEQVGARCSLMN